MLRSTVFLCAAAIAPAQFFPLQVGNQWIYRVGEGPVRDVRVAEVVSAEQIDGVEYFGYRGLFGEMPRLRVDKTNRLVQRNADGSESVWADFSAAEGTSYATGFDRCTGRARVEAKDVLVDALDRQWGGGVRVSYSAANCADAGVTGDVFVPGLGLTERTFNTFTGPRRYQLTYARIGNASVIASGEYGFRLSLDQREYPSKARIMLRLTLENWTKTPLVLNFTSGQSYDFSVRTETGETVYTWSATRLFPAVIRDETVSGERNWVVTDELDLRPGNYVIEARLTDRTQAFRAQAPFTVVKETP
ncbi:MAG: hypothetical protein FJW38_27100 [Acidobacteria bacterium]|nr:hypothetical protein [Acidobacteriota bacterium]